ncbi:hypothetical protein CLV58_15011 [Spirosoma oryzae]|uniref:Uncharacterized protein n=1 Tax=Spirosoma oryzae TaxID=1469603 RepID=A0A2T0RK68_9BACT|nr:hypothetical protein [Spirosoma oryzae]PRY21573.1 hypothetical protein CLV58_15011 [Spirosoma oryzae]
MENHQSVNPQSSSTFSQIKESIRDMVRLQRDYQLSDELFWEAFDRRVLRNVPLNMTQYATMTVRS